MALCLQPRHQQTALDHDRGLPAGAHDDGPVHHAGIADQKAPGQEAAHAVAQQEEGHAGEVRLHFPAQGRHIVHRLLPAVLVCKVDGRAALRQGLAVAQMVVAHHRKALFHQEPGEAVISANILRHAVGDLQNRTGSLGVVAPEPCVEGRGAIGGRKGKILDI